MAKPQPRYKRGDRIDGRFLVRQGLMGKVYLCLDEQEMSPNFPSLLMSPPLLQVLLPLVGAMAQL